MANPDHSVAARALLSALEAMGRANEAHDARAEFERRGWQLNATDVAALATMLSAPPAPQPELPFKDAIRVQPTPSEKRAAGRGEELLRPLAPFMDAYRPFLEAIPGWSDLLGATNQLLLSRSWDELRESAATVFCDALGFDEDRVSLTHRLIGKSTIEDFEQVGTFAGFRVCLVRLTRTLSDTRWSNASVHYLPCFRLAPRAILLSYEPGAGAIRLVYRQRFGRAETRPRYRCLVGPWFLRDSQENLLTMCRRLHLCRPGFDEDPEAFARRIQAALECEAGALARDWSSVVVADSDPLPGLALPDASTRLMRAFMDVDEWCWGLKAHFTNVFPTPVRFGGVWLDLDDIKFIDEPSSADLCWRQRRSREQVLELHLSLRSWADLEVIDTLRIRSSLLVPDEQGWFWVEGRPYRHVPGIGLDGRLLSRTAMPTWVDQLDDDDEYGEEDAAGSYPLDAAEGAVVDALLGRAMERRLWLLIRHVRRKARDSATAGQLRTWLLAAVPPGEPLPLLTAAAARALLTPVDVSRSLADMSDVVSAGSSFVDVPPAWACPDVSAHLDPDRWAVVAGARVHPTGALAVPIASDDGLRLRATGASAFEVNPRLADVPSGPRSWWIHRRLRQFAVLAPGVLKDASRVAAAGVTVEVPVVISDEIRVPQVAPWLRPSPSVVRTFVDMPKLGGVKVVPLLLAKAGERLSAGAPWVRIPVRHLAHPIDEVDSNLSSIPLELPEEVTRGGLVQRLPWDADIVVRAVGLEPVIRLGVTIGWRAWLEAEPKSPELELLAPDGSLSKVAPGWTPEDLPHNPGGEVFDIGIPGEAGDALWFSGVDGEAIEVGVAASATLVPFAPRPREFAAVGTVDRLPRPGVRSQGEAWSFSRMRWLSEGAPTRMADALDGGGLSRQLLGWCVGLTMPPPGLPVEDVTEVPIASKPHLVGKVLSDVEWTTACSCAQLQGASVLGAVCKTCGTRVRAYEVVRTFRRVRLPGVVIHPWARELSASLLGLTEDELNVLVVRHGPTAVLEACSKALANPSASARQRHGLPKSHSRALDGQARRRLGQCIELLERVDPAEIHSCITLQHVGVPSLELVKVGHTLDEIDQTGNRLMAAYGRLHGACWAVRQARRRSVQALEVTALVHLQECVDRVLGEPEAVEPTSLAGLLRTLSPWSRGGRPPVVGSAQPSAVQPRSVDWWAMRAARARILQRHAMDLVSILVCSPALDGPERKVVAGALATDLLDQQRDLRGLASLLEAERDRPLQLPSDWTEARASLMERCSPGLGDVALRAIVHTLGGWWMGEPSAEVPTGVVWQLPGEAGPVGYRRRVPPLGHAVWRTWPGPMAARPELSLVGLLGVPPFRLPVELVETPNEEPEGDVVVRIDVMTDIEDEVATVSASPVEHERSQPGACIPVVGEPTTPSAQKAPDIVPISMAVRAWMESP